MKRPLGRLVAAVVVAAPLAFSGCSGTLRYPGTETFTLAQGYDGKRPADVCVLAVSGSISAEAGAALREGLRERLLELKYAPVRLDEVDRKPADYRPGGKNSVLEINVTKWDDASLYGDGTLRVSGEVRLFGGGSLDVLYHGKLEDVPVQASFVARTTESRPTTLNQAAAEAALRFLHGLPVKGDG